VIRPMWRGKLSDSANHKAPSGPVAMPLTFVSVGGANPVTVPLVVILPTSGLPANHNAPSGPEVMPPCSVPTVAGTLNPVKVPLVVIRPIPGDPRNHSAPSGPAVMPPRELGSGRDIR
jgi:hypothetical protein